MNFSLTLSILLACLAPAQDQSGSVSGVVLDTVTHQPIRKATVHFDPLGGGMGAGATIPVSKSTVTDAAGSFTLANVDPGKYSVTAQHANYLDGRGLGASKTVEIKAGENAASINVELIPGASISGHVVDEDGDPMNGCGVLATPQSVNGRGGRFNNASVSPEDGSFRIYGMPPGKYILRANCRQPAFQPRPFSAGPELPPSAAYPAQFYPAVADLKSAQPVEIFPGSEKTGIEFRMRPAPVTQINGVFTSGIDSAIRPLLNVHMIPFEDHSPWSGATNAVLDRERPTFQFPQVFPGSYALAAFAFPNGGPDNAVGAFQRVDVKNTPVEVALELHPAMKIQGTIEIEGAANSAPGTQPLTPNQCSVELNSEYQIGSPSARSQAAADGTFVLVQVLPGLWRLRVNAPNAFLKAAWLGTTEVTKSVIDLTSGSAAALKLLMSTNTATLRGTGPPGEMIFALNQEDVANGSNGTIVDQNGQFNFPHLAPGSYRIVASNPGGPPPDEGGQEITLHEGETAMIDVKARSN
jgi:hypothetical protein